MDLDDHKRLIRIEVYPDSSYFRAILEIRGANGLQSDWMECESAPSLTGALANAMMQLAPLEAEARKANILAGLIPRPER